MNCNCATKQMGDIMNWYKKKRLQMKSGEEPYYCQRCVYASCGGSVSMKFSFYISLRLCGQDAASKPQP
jgi:hypothetical protein